MRSETNKKPAKTLVRLIMAGFLTLMWGCCTVLAGDANGPQIFFEKNVVHVGDVHEGEVIEHGFRVFNRGDETLRIEKVKPG
jgi:hypothetical protein